MGEALPIVIRDMRPSEINFARKPWLARAAESAFARCMGRKAFFSGHHAIVTRLLTRATVRLAVSEENDQVFVGFACIEPPNVVHFVYVAEDFRRAGVARRLLEGLDDACVYTHRTDLCKQLPIPASWWFNFYRAVQP